MATDLLQIGNFIFEADDLPSEVPLGKETMVNVIKYPGGKKEVQVFGTQDINPKWSGVLNYSNAIQKAQTLDGMSGKVWTLQIGSVKIMNVLLLKFEWKYQSSIMIPYDIELEIAPAQSLVVPSGSGTPTSTTGTTGTAPAVPASNASSPQRVHIVQQDETLWEIAFQYYQDGSQYRKIVTANPIITNPDQIQAGWKLVIP